LSGNYFSSLYQEFIYVSRYARFLTDENRRETWPETVKRYFDFYSDYIKTHNDYELTKEERKELEDAVLSLDVVPSMRGLMTAGPALKRDSMAQYNCAFLPVDSVKAFDETLHTLMNGCFSEETLIATKNGPKKISEITIDDEVLSFDFDKNEYVFINPSWQGQPESSIGKEKYEIEFEDGTIIRCTENHEFFTINRGWVEAKDLTEEDDIQNYHEIK
jgi:hypothetical protein